MLPVSREKYNAVVAERDNIAAKIATTEASLTTLATIFDCTVEELETTASTLVNEFAKLKDTNLNELLGENETLKSDIERANLDIRQASEQIEALNDLISEKNAQIEDLNATITRLNETPGEPLATVIAQGDGNPNIHENLRTFCENNEDDINAVLAKIKKSGLYD